MKTKEYMVVAIAVVVMCGTANAAIISFDSLNGVNGAPYLGHVEDGFTVASIAGTWQEAHLFGNPIPSIFGTTAIASVQVTNGVFTFASVDLADAFPGSCPVCATFSITGFLNNNPVLTLGGTTTSTVFQTFLSPNSSQPLDRLVITMNKGTATYNIDNIVVNAVPEPGTFILFGISLAGLAIARCKRLV